MFKYCEHELDMIELFHIQTLKLQEVYHVPEIEEAGHPVVDALWDDYSVLPLAEQRDCLERKVRESLRRGVR